MRDLQPTARWCVWFWGMYFCKYMYVVVSTSPAYALWGGPKGKTVALGVGVRVRVCLGKGHTRLLN